MSLKVITSFLASYILFAGGVAAQLPEQDCTGAIVEVNALDTFPISYADTGLISELIFFTNTSCLQGGEENSVWIRFAVCTADTLELLIIPVALTDDFDFAIYDITNKTCEEAVSSSFEMRCNYSAIDGPTGLKYPYTGTSESPSGPNKCAPIICEAGQEFLLLVNNFDGTNFGFKLSFDGNVTPCIYNLLTSLPKLHNFTLSPNPSTGLYHLDGLPFSNVLTAEVSDMTGRVRMQRHIDPGVHEIDLRNVVEPGIYILRVMKGSEVLGMEILIITN